MYAYLFVNVTKYQVNDKTYMYINIYVYIILFYIYIYIIYVYYICIYISIVSNFHILLILSHQGIIQEIFFGGGSTVKCDHDYDQALIKSSWESV